MNNEQRELEIGQRIRKTLDASANSLAPSVEERLLASRQKALGRAGSWWHQWLKMPRLLPVTGAATLAVTVIAVSLWYTSRPQVAINKVEDLEVLTIASSLDMYKDLEMLQWLAESDDAG